MLNDMVHTSQSEWIDLKQAEREFPLSRRTLWSWISSGKLPAYRPFKKILLKKSDLVRVLESTRVGADLDRIVDECVREVAGG
jgi:excisionase family DNA binding protein